MYVLLFRKLATPELKAGIVNVSVPEAKQLLLMNEAGQWDRVRSGRDCGAWESHSPPRGPLLPSFRFDNAGLEIQPSLPSFQEKLEI